MSALLLYILGGAELQVIPSRAFISVDASQAGAFSDGDKNLYGGRGDFVWLVGCCGGSETRTEGRCARTRLGPFYINPKYLVQTTGKKINTLGWEYCACTCKEANGDTAISEWYHSWASPIMWCAAKGSEHVRGLEYSNIELVGEVVEGEEEFIGDVLEGEKFVEEIEVEDIGEKVEEEGVEERKEDESAVNDVATSLLLVSHRRPDPADDDASTYCRRLHYSHRRLPLTSPPPLLFSVAAILLHHHRRQLPRLLIRDQDALMDFWNEADQRVKELRSTSTTPNRASARRNIVAVVTFYLGFMRTMITESP
nr:hypothetical protein Itr_chr03CG10640 [Ipomoea trifida]